MKAIVLLADGFEECEALITVDILRRAGIETVMASVMDGLTVASSRSIKVQADVMAGEADYDSADILILPGGRVGVDNLTGSARVKERCAEFAAGKRLAAICAAPSLLAGLGLLEGKQATCHPDVEGEMAGARLTHSSVAVDGNVITGRALGATFDFAFEIVRTLVGEEAVQKVSKAICY